MPKISIKVFSMLNGKLFGGYLLLELIFLSVSFVMIAFGVVVVILASNFVALLFLLDVIPYLFIVEFLFPDFTGRVVEVDVTIGKGVGRLDILFDEVMKL